MNYIQRFVLSLKRNMTKMIPLFFVVFILGNVVCSAVAIRQSTLQTKQAFMKAYGAKIQLGYNDGISNVIYDSNSAEYVKVSELFKKCESLPLYNYSNIAYVSTLFSSSDLKYEENEIVYFENEDMKLYLWGMSNGISIDEKKYEVELVEGRHFNNDELSNYSKVALVSENFKIKENGEYRDIQIGDFIDIQSVIYSGNEAQFKSNAKFEVIGIYKRTKYVQNNEKGYSIDNNLTKVIVPLSTLELMNHEYNEKCKEVGEYAYNKLFASNAYFQLKDESLTQEFFDNYYKILNNEMIPYGFEMKSFNEIYEKIGIPIESLSNVADFVLITSSIVTGLVLCLIVFIMLRNRKHEVGILSALGESRLKIIAQFVLEIYFVGALALSMSTFTGCKLADVYSNRMMDKEEVIVDEYSQKDLIELYEVEVSMEYIYGVLGIGSLILVCSSIIPIAYILKLEPKKIML